ncbi:MAG: glucokinase [Anaerolineae bacterium]|nr:glucokinase [Anaerolineae bacterium]
MLLAGDLGGTKTNLAIYSTIDALHAPLTEATYPSGSYDSLEALVSDFLATLSQHGIDRADIRQASFGVAGPVVADQASITNLPWEMNEQQLAESLAIPEVELINDMVAVDSGVAALDASDVYTLNEGHPVDGGAIVVIAPGTGLGEAYLIWDGTHYRAFASEGGHTDFAPTNDREIGLLQYLLARHEHVSYERVCSGMGIPNIYAYLKQSGLAEEPAWLTEQLAATKDPTPVIVNTALDTEKSCTLCQQTLEMFVEILAREAGNMALNILSTGGVYLGGGIPPRILPVLKNRQFFERFQHKGRFTRLLNKMPVKVILNPKAALLGAAYHGFTNLQW